MCSELHHRCRRCGREFDCYEPNWICPTMNFDENANLCKQCEIEVHEEYLKFELEERK